MPRVIGLIEETNSIVTVIRKSEDSRAAAEIRKRNRTEETRPGPGEMQTTQASIKFQVPDRHPSPKNTLVCRVGGDIPARTGPVPASRAKGHIKGGVTGLVVRQSSKWRPQSGLALLCEGSLWGLTDWYPEFASDGCFPLPSWHIRGQWLRTHGLHLTFDL